MARRPRVDSADGKAVAMQGAGMAILPPSNVPLDVRDLPFFASVIDEFARSEWTAHQLEIAAMLARTMSDMEQEQRLLRDEGSVLATERGTPVVNPRKTVVQMYASTILSYRRSLQLHARAQGGEARDVAKRRGMAKGVEGDAPDDDLLARPN